MNIKFTYLLLFNILLFSINSVIAQEEEDLLKKRVYNTSLNEVKDGVPAKKVLADKLEFKNGKVFSDYLWDKFQFKWIKYRINKDSVYTDSTGVEVRELWGEATATDANNQTVVLSFDALEWEIEGNIKITKNDKIKKYYELVGRVKGGKPKKHKKGDMKDGEKPKMEGEENKDY